VAAAAGLVVGLTATGIAGGRAGRRHRPRPPTPRRRPTHQIVVGSVAAASVLAVAAGTVIRTRSRP
jgi:hypothetical protein